MKDKKIDRRSKEYKKLQAIENMSVGVGDTIEKITKATGIKKLVKVLFGDDCGCDERKERLNKLFKYKTECLTEEEFNYLNETLPRLTAVIHNKDQARMLAIFNRVFNQNHKATSCSACWKAILAHMNRIYLEYKTEME